MDARVIATATTNFKQGNQLKLSISCSNFESLVEETMSVKEKSSKLALDFPPMGSAPALITSAGSEPVSTADGDGVLTSTFSVSTATTNTNVSTSNTAPKHPKLLLKIACQ